MTALELALCIGLISVSAFISASEVAVFSLSRFQIRSLRDRSKKAWRILRKLLNDPAGLLTTLLVTNEIVNIALTTIIAGVIDNWWRRDTAIGPALEALLGWPQQYTWILQVLLGALITTPILLIFCEVTPKTVAARGNQVLAPLVAQPLLRLYQALLPVRFLLIELLRVVRRIFLTEPDDQFAQANTSGARPHALHPEAALRHEADARPAGSLSVEDEPAPEIHRELGEESGEAPEPRHVLNEEDFLSIVEQGKAEGAIEEDELELIRRVFELDDRKVRDILTPIAQVRMIASNTRVNDALERMRGQHRFTRIPVHAGGSRREVIGILYSKDLLLARLDPKLATEPVEKLARKPFVVAPDLQLNSLFRRLKGSRTHMAIVESSPGVAIGVVTMSDVLEALFEDYAEVDDEQSPTEKELGK